MRLLLVLPVYRRILLLCCVVLGVFPPGAMAHAQARGLPLAHWQHTRWAGTNGPPVPGNYEMVRSADGYLWLSGYGSLIRFDGARFTVFDSLVEPALVSAEVGNFEPRLIDRHGTLWLSGPGSEVITYREGSFQRHAPVPGLLTGEDEAGVIWVRGGKPFRVVGERPQPLPLPATAESLQINFVIGDRAGGQWLGSRTDGLWHLSHEGAARQLIAGNVWPMLVTRDGALWARGQDVKGIARWADGRWTPLRLPDGSVVEGRKAVEGEDGSVWFQTNTQGVVRYQDGVVQTFTTENGLSDDRVRSIAVDPTGGVWISTDAGLDRLRPAEFAMLENRRGPASPSERIRVAPDNSIWALGRGGASIVHLEHGLAGNDGQPLRTTVFEVGPGEPNLIGVTAGSSALLRIFRGPLIQLDPDGKRRTIVPAASLPGDRHIGGLVATDGTIWLEGFPRGLGTVRDGHFRSVTAAGLDTAEINAYVEDGRGRIWIAHDDLTDIVALAGDSVVATVRVPLAHVDDIALEQGDTLWAMSEHGLTRIIGDTAVLIRSGALSPVLSPRISLAIARGSVWIASTSGTARVSLADLHRVADGDTAALYVHIFDHLDGLTTPRTSASAWKSAQAGPDGRVWIASAAGLAVTTSLAPTTAVEPPTILIEEATLDGRMVPAAGLLRARPGRLDVHFTATRTALPERTRLQYRLTGSDRDWVDGSLPRVATYGNLDPGRYEFAVRALDETGKQIGRIATRQFRVLPAWNQSWWFFALLTLLVAAAAGGITVLWQRRRYRLAAQLAQREFDAVLAERRTQFEATLAERTRIAQDLHDTLLQGFAGVSMQLKAAERSLPEEPDVAAETLVRVQQLTRETLREARERVMDLHEPELGTDHVATALAASADTLVATTGIVFQLEIRGTPRRLPRVVEIATLRIGREAIANAVKHAEARRIECVVDFGVSLLRLEVRDDGLGFTADAGEQAQREGHFGLSGMRRRAEQAGGSIDVQSRPGEGTNVRLELPVPGSLAPE